MDNGWNELSENIVKNIGDMSLGYKWMYTTMAKWYFRKHRYLIFVCYILNGCVSSLTTLSYTYGMSEVQLFILILSFLELVTIIFVQQGKYNELGRECQNFASKYVALSSNTRRQLSIYKSERESGVDYLGWVAKNYDDLFEMAPQLEAWVIKMYEKEAVLKGLPIPDTVNQISAIDIVEEHKSPGSVVLHVKEKKEPNITRQVSVDLNNKYDDKIMKYEMERLKYQR